MKKYRIEIKPTAESDLAKRYHEIAKDSPQNAINWYFNTISATEKLDELPERCPLAPSPKNFSSLK